MIQMDNTRRVRARLELAIVNLTIASQRPVTCVRRGASSGHSQGEGENPGVAPETLLTCRVPPASLVGQRLLPTRADKPPFAPGTPRTNKGGATTSIERMPGTSRLRAGYWLEL
jgi:hypothetical protein